MLACLFFLWCAARVSRIGSEFRVTKETSVEINIDLDGNGICDCDTGIPFLDHMLDVSDYSCVHTATSNTGLPQVVL
jgi:imidazoleglycerol phosphate dehydratase HisB